ncbi:hypothetical protein ACFLUB_01605 [Chloroflexota bacterium]
MGMFRRNQSNDVLFLMPVRLADEKMPKGKARMLYCDAAGKVYASLINRSAYELARESAERMEHSHKSFATIGLEIGPGKFIPTAVEIGSKEVWALEHILEHALKKGRLPDILKKYLQPIIKLGEASREVILSEHKKRRRRVYSGATPRVLNRLPYYPEHDIEFSIPIYKAKHSYPLIVLKHLPLEEITPHNIQKLVILDNDGDLATIKVPNKLIGNMEKGLVAQEGNVCAIISQHPKGMAINYMPISQAQRKALYTITRYFEENGYGKQPASAAVKAVLNKAKDSVSSPVQ